eukprot:SAG31_NODE_47902_length_208_cov_78.669725_2_plen_41_part_01
MRAILFTGTTGTKLSKDILNLVDLLRTYFKIYYRRQVLNIY